MRVGFLIVKLLDGPFCFLYSFGRLMVVLVDFAAVWYLVSGGKRKNHSKVRRVHEVKKKHTDFRRSLRSFEGELFCASHCSGRSPQSG